MKCYIGTKLLQNEKTKSCQSKQKLAHKQKLINEFTEAHAQTHKT